MRAKTKIRKLIGEALFLRARVNAMESEVKDLREQFEQAKRRRKEAKKSAQRARTQYKTAKSELADLCQTLTEAESKLQRAGVRAPVRRAPRSRMRKQVKARRPATATRKPAKRKLKRIPRAQKLTPTRPRKRLPRSRIAHDQMQAEGTELQAAQPNPQPPIIQPLTTEIYEQERHGEEKRETQDEEI